VSTTAVSTSTAVLPAESVVPVAPAAETIVAWQSDGNLVVLDPLNGSVLRTLATVASRMPFLGPSDVTLSADRKLAIVSWRTGEPGCFTRIGALPTDGSGSLVEWGDGGTSPTVSPDGRRIAWLALSAPLCEKQELVVRTLATGAERRVTVVDNAKGFTGAYGPWWRTDNATLLFGYLNTVRSTAALSVYDADTAALRPKTEPVVLGCLQAYVGRPLPDGTGVLVAGDVIDGQPTLVELCRFDQPDRTSSLVTPPWTLGASLNRGGTRLLVGDLKGALSTATLDGTTTPLSNGPFLAAAW
jgi:hypothetical protein